jgi:hypothetical protein
MNSDNWLFEQQNNALANKAKPTVEIFLDQDAPLS